MFSVHDIELYSTHPEIIKKGFHFIASSESRSLNKEEYGTTFVTEVFVQQAIDRIAGKDCRRYRMPKGICMRQDLYVMCRDLESTFPTFVPCLQPIGHIEAAEILSTGLTRLSGWAVDLNEDGIVTAKIYRNGHLILNLQPDLDREDVVNNFEGRRDLLQSGWECFLPAPSHPDDAILVEFINKSGLISCQLPRIR